MERPGSDRQIHWQGTTMGKSLHPIRNWSEYNRGLVERGNLTVWMDASAIKFKGQPPQNPGRSIQSIQRTATPKPWPQFTPPQPLKSAAVLQEISGHELFCAVSAAKLLRFGAVFWQAPTPNAGACPVGVGAS